ncbi:universal stress protein [Kangiella sp. TOML190]|uniref:universal stress protein n=1 Tax=Kangiella sp. TOML190 TaxID=2931351 RepID=UPI0020422A1D|nr:universal stress protein [Kangiella sp. TOML190]
MYAKILVAIDLRKESRRIIKKAASLLKPNGKLVLLHVIEPSEFGLFSAFPFGVLADVQDAESKVMVAAQSKMNALLKAFKLSEKSALIEVGKASRVIKSKAEELKSDLIVIGTHGQKGYELLLGSTANGVTQGAPCDVLTLQMRINKKR